MLSTENFDIKFTSREVSAWGGLVLLKKMMGGMGVFRAIQYSKVSKTGQQVWGIYADF